MNKKLSNALKYTIGLPSLLIGTLVITFMYVTIGLCMNTKVDELLDTLNELWKPI